MTTNPRPFAEQARYLCPESAEHHDQVWFCMTCNMIERRLTPIFDLPVHQALLQEANLSLSIEIGEILSRIGT